MHRGPEDDERPGARRTGRQTAFQRARRRGPGCQRFELTVTCAGCPYGTFGRLLRGSIQRSSVGPVYWTKRAAALPLRGSAAACGGWRLRGRLALFVEEPTGLARGDRDAGARRPGDRDLLQVAAFGGGRLEPDHLVDRRCVVLEQRLLVEGGLADDEAGVPVPADPALDLSALDLAHG